MFMMFLFLRIYIGWHFICLNTGNSLTSTLDAYFQKCRHIPKEIISIYIVHRDPVKDPFTRIVILIQAQVSKVWIQVPAQENLVVRSQSETKELRQARRKQLQATNELYEEEEGLLYGAGIAE
ncbi:hypothetical protein ABEB36_015006 [Hypothenemus hampei]|uniref:Uncharacterized protein n=1 Tax=Hypothenemus hampei TaxID=57062 RepID=A0ABD1E1K1_HYPHA